MFAFVMSWVSILVLIGGIGLMWALLRGIGEVVAWMREETIDDFRRKIERDERNEPEEPER